MKFIKYLFLFSFSIIISAQLKNKVEIIENITQFETILKDKPKVIINFYGSCFHCPPGREKFIELVENSNSIDIKFYEFKVNDKPLILQKYSIKERPTVIGFFKGKEFPIRLVQNQIAKEGFDLLLSIFK